MKTVFTYVSILLTEFFLVSLALKYFFVFLLVLTDDASLNAAGVCAIFLSILVCIVSIFALFGKHFE